MALPVPWKGWTSLSDDAVIITNSHSNNDSNGDQGGNKGEASGPQ